jgi:tetratricopeptide (TPR) repeat protein
MNRCMVLRFMVLISVLFLLEGCSTVRTEPGHSSGEFQEIEDCPLILQSRIELDGSRYIIVSTAWDWMENTFVSNGNTVPENIPGEVPVVGYSRVTLETTKGPEVIYDFEYGLSIDVVGPETIITVLCQYGIGQMDHSTTIVIEPHLLHQDDLAALKTMFASIMNDAVVFIENGCRAEELNDRGVARWESGDIEGAIADFSSAIEIYPSFGCAYDNRAIIKYGGGDWEGAIADFSKAIDYGYTSFNTYACRGYARQMMGDYDPALRDYAAALELDPGSSALFNNRGWIFILLEQYEDAVTELESALKLTEDSDYFDSRGWAYFFLDRFGNARQDAEAALELNPENYNARALQYRIDLAEGRQDVALSSLNAYLADRDDQDIEDPYFLILMYFANRIGKDVLVNRLEWDDLRIALREY